MTGNTRQVMYLSALCASVALTSASPALSQLSASQPSPSPLAYIYVARPTHIDGFAAAADGRLTPVPGSPFANTNVTKLSVTKKFLLGESGNGFFVTSYAIAANGSLTKASTLDTRPYVPEQPCVIAPDIQVDTAGSTLYYQEEDESCGDDTTAYLSFHIESDGGFQYLGPSGGYIDPTAQGPTFTLSMLGNGKFAYDGSCQEDNGNTSDINIYKRETNGLLTYINQDNYAPEGKSGEKYCSGLVAADSQNHLAVALQRIDGQNGDNGPLYGPWFLASYTAGSSGNLTTTSTAVNMPEVSVGGQYDVDAMSISPDNKYVAVSGEANGFEIFHFNGGSPVTKYSGVFLPRVSVYQFGWDKADHLYAVGGGNVYVFTVTSTSIRQAPGSPYSIPENGGLIVRDLE